jgi:flagellar biosynthesis component FlhA
MTIDEAKAAKMALRKRINQALREFTDDTGLLVESLHVNQSMTMDGRCGYWLDLEVRL